MTKKTTKKTKLAASSPRKEPQDLRAQLIVKKSSAGKGAGLGIFTTEPIKKGKFVIEYVGPLLNDEQVQKKGGKYLFGLGKKWTIDGTSRKNIARYINHSCLPNCEPIQYAQRIRIKSRKNIKAGEELTYDYGKEYFDEFIGKKCRCPKHSKKKIKK